MMEGPRNRLALEDADEPMELAFFYECICALVKDVVSIGAVVDAFCGRLGGSDPPLEGPQPTVLPLHHSRRD